MEMRCAEGRNYTLGERGYDCLYSQLWLSSLHDSIRIRALVTGISFVVSNGV